MKEPVPYDIFQNIFLQPILKQIDFIHWTELIFGILFQLIFISIMLILQVSYKEENCSFFRAQACLEKRIFFFNQRDAFVQCMYVFNHAAHAPSSEMVASSAPPKTTVLKSSFPLAYERYYC